MCGQQKGQNRAKSHVWLTLKKITFLEISRIPFQVGNSAIAENHWPYIELHIGLFIVLSVVFPAHTGAIYALATTDRLLLRWVQMYAE